MQRSYAPLLKALGITYVQYLVLLVLWEGDGLSVSEIGRRLVLDSGTLTPVLRRLELSGLLTRRRAARDERELEICLTAAGKQLERKLSRVQAEVACKAALEPPERASLREALRALASRLSHSAGS